MIVTAKVFENVGRNGMGMHGKRQRSRATMPGQFSNDVADFGVVGAAAAEFLRNRHFEKAVLA